eukprot:COSAG02_NODE_4232_length_5607_cov_1.383805_1_plen_501_part_00
MCTAHTMTLARLTAACLLFQICHGGSKSASLQPVELTSGAVGSTVASSPTANGRQNTSTVCTADGLRLAFDGAKLVGTSIGGRTLRNSNSTASPGGFRVRSYTSLAPSKAEPLSNSNFNIPGETDALARDWTSVGGGYRRQLQMDKTAAIVLRNDRTNLSAGAAQDVLLSREVWGSRNGTLGPVALRLSGWAAADNLRSDGTCADEGSCRLHDAFGLSATLTFIATDGAKRSISLPTASFQSGSHMPEYSFAVLEIPSLSRVQRDSQYNGTKPSANIIAESEVVNASLRVVLMLKGYAGTVTFTNISLVRMPWTDFVNVEGGKALTRLNSSALRINAVTQPSSIEDNVAAVPPLALNATISARERHIRIDGKVTLLDAPIAALQSAAVDDHALTIQFSIPVDIDEKKECWKLGIDADTITGIPHDKCQVGSEAINEYGGRGLLHGRRQRGYYDGAGEEGTVEGEVMVPPLPSGMRDRCVSKYEIHAICICCAAATPYAHR